MTRPADPRVPRWLLALLSGALLALSFPGSGDQGWAVFAALVPLLAAVEGANWRRAATLGFGAGVVFWVATIPWIAATMVRYGDLPWPLAALVLAGLAGYLALYWAAFCALLSRVPMSGGARFVVVAASLWVALEFLRTYLLTGFPWNLLGYSQYRHVPLIQVAAVTGIYGVSFVVVAANAALWRLLAADRGWKDALAAAATAAGVVALALGSAWLPPRDAGEPTRAVALVQGSIEQSVKWDPAYQDTTLAIYRALTVEAAREGARLIIWPETSLPFVFDEDARRAAVQGLARETGAYLLVGAPGRAPDGPRNSAFVVAPDGEVVGRYDKRHLVPFGEYIPLRSLLPFVEVLGGGAIGEFRPGREATIFSTPLGRLAVVICYEAIFPSEVRDFVLGGADMLVNITNDAWFGRSAAPVQHLAMAAFRAVENRTYLVRAANTGISAIVAPDGRMVQTSGSFTREIVSGTIAPRAGFSVYTRFGDVFAWMTVAAALAVVWPTGAIRRVAARRIAKPPLALGDETGGVHQGTGRSAMPQSNHLTRGLVGVVALILWLAIVGGVAPARAAEELAAMDLGPPPQPHAAPEFTLPLLSGGTIALKDLRGKPIVVHFWTTWCQPCKIELPLLEKFHRAHKDRGVIVLAISVDASADVVRKYVAEGDYTFPVLLDPDYAVADRFRLRGLPGTFIVGRDGYVKARGHGPREWDSPAARKFADWLLAPR